MAESSPPTLVTAAVVERAGRLLVTRRLEGTHLAGHWEFPGGKCEAGESPEQTLAEKQDTLAAQQLKTYALLPSSFLAQFPNHAYVPLIKK